MATKTTTPNTSLAVHTDTVCSRILVGIDRSAESIEAARQAAILREPGGSLTLLAAWMLPPPVIGVVSPEFAYRRRGSRDRGRDLCGCCRDGSACFAAPAHDEDRARLRLGRTDQGDHERARDSRRRRRQHATGRVRGILIGSTATAIVHKAPCSVLIARRAASEFPTRIVVGVDGSWESAAAYTAAAHLAGHFGAELWPLVARGGKGVDKQLVTSIVDYHHEDLPDDPVTALVAASADADLVIVGSRGLHGPKALGSVSERVAHRAQCSTLIVREPTSQRKDAS
jgi:nucleotide-binding universal stress UspA family protein